MTAVAYTFEVLRHEVFAMHTVSTCVAAGVATKQLCRILLLYWSITLYLGTCSAWLWLEQEGGSASTATAVALCFGYLSRRVLGLFCMGVCRALCITPYQVFILQKHWGRNRLQCRLVVNVCSTHDKRLTAGLSFMNTIKLQVIF